MRKTTWIRFGLASMLATGASMAVFGTGCSSSKTPTTTPEDSGVEDSSTPTDGSSKPGDSGTDGSKPGDSGTDGSKPGDSGTDATPTPPPPPWVNLVNASPDLGPVMLCMGAYVSGVLDVPGTPPIGGQALPQYAGNGIQYAAPPPYNSAIKDLTAYTVVLYGVPAATYEAASAGIDGGALCSNLTTADAGTFYTIGQIDAGTLTKGDSYVLAMTGCTPNDAPNATKCGATYDGGTSNLNLAIWPLDNTTVVDGGIGVQFIQASTQWDFAGKYGAGANYVGVVPAVTDNKVYVNLQHINDETDDAGADAASDAAMDSGSDGMVVLDSGSDAVVDMDSGSDAMMDASDDTSVPPLAPFTAFAPPSMFGAGAVNASAWATTDYLATEFEEPSDAGVNPGLFVFATTADASMVYVPAGDASVALALGFKATTMSELSFGVAADGGPNNPPVTGTFLGSGNWTFILMGDPLAAGGPVLETDAGPAINPLYTHIIALPNQAP